MSNEIALYGLSADGGVTIWTDNGTRMPHWHSEKGVTPLNEALDAYNASDFPYRFVRLWSLPAALNAERNEKAVGLMAAALWNFARRSCERPTGLTGREPDDDCGECATCVARAALNPKEGE